MPKAKVLNGIDMDRLADLAAEAGAGSGREGRPARAHAEWQGGGRSLITVSPAGTDGARKTAPIVIAADSLSSLVSQGEAAHPEQLLLAALASDLVARFVRSASERGTRIEALEIEADGAVEHAARSDSTRNGATGAAGITLNVLVHADDPVERLGQIWSDAQQASPVLSLLRKSARVSLGFTASRDQRTNDQPKGAGNGDLDAGSQG
jgi:uncharacterized OsmC-like protein